MKLLMWIVRKIAERYGYVVVPSTPVRLLAARVNEITAAVEHSGHLGHRFHVRRTLNRAIERTMGLVLTIEDAVSP